MSEVELNVDVYMNAFMSIPNGSPVAVDLEKTKEIITLVYQLRQKLESAEAECARLQLAEQAVKNLQTYIGLYEPVEDFVRNHASVELGDSVSDACLRLLKERDQFEADIREAREQKAAVIFQGLRHNSRVEMWGLITEHAELIPPNAELYLAPPAPAMPIQDDKTIEVVANFVETQNIESISPKAMAEAIRAYFKSQVKPS